MFSMKFSQRGEPGVGRAGADLRARLGRRRKLPGGRGVRSRRRMAGRMSLLAIGGYGLVGCFGGGRRGGRADEVDRGHDDTQDESEQDRRTPTAYRRELHCSPYFL